MADNADLAQEQMDRAMQRFDSGRAATQLTSRHGSDCAECGEAIDPNRLKIFPYAIRCSGCQSDYESKR